MQISAKRNGTVKPTRSVKIKRAMGAAASVGKVLDDVRGGRIRPIARIERDGEREQGEGGPVLGGGDAQDP